MRDARSKRGSSGSSFFDQDVLVEVCLEEGKIWRHEDADSCTKARVSSLQRNLSFV